jgi:hypothetical protein
VIPTMNRLMFILVSVTQLNWLKSYYGGHRDVAFLLNSAWSVSCISELCPLELRLGKWHVLLDLFYSVDLKFCHHSEWHVAEI